MSDQQARLVISAVDETQQAINSARRGLSSLEGSAVGIGKALGALGGAAIGGIALKQLATEAIQASDAFTRVASQLKLVTNNTAEAVDVQGRLFTIAQGTRQSFTELAATYTSIARAAGELGMSQTSLLSLTETISKAVQISGASPEAAKAALVQLGQGLSSGTLRGEELNSVLEQTPRLAKAIADGLGVPIGELRRLGEQGELTADKVTAALTKSRAVIDSEFSKLAPTTGDAFQRLANSAGNLVSKLDEAIGVSKVLRTSLIALSSVLDTIATGVQARVNTSISAVQQQTLDNINRQLDGLDPRSSRAVELQKQRSKLLVATAGAGDDGSYGNLESRRARDALQAVRGPSGAYLELVTKLSGNSKDFQKSLSTLFTEYQRGGITIEDYRKQVGKLIATETELGKAQGKREQTSTPKRLEQSPLTQEQKAWIDAYQDIERLRIGADDFRKQLAVLDDQFFAGRITVEQYDAIVQQLTKSTETAGDAILAATEKAANKWRDALDPTREYRRQLEEINKLEGVDGGLSPTEAVKARAEVFKRIDDLTKTGTDSIKEQRSEVEKLGLTFSSAFEDAIVKGGSLSDVLKGVLQDLQRLFIRQSITNPVASWFGDLLKPAATGWVSGFDLPAGAAPKAVSAAGVTVVNNIDARADMATINAMVTKGTQSAVSQVLQAQQRGMWPA